MRQTSGSVDPSGSHVVHFSLVSLQFSHLSLHLIVTVERDDYRKRLNLRLRVTLLPSKTQGPRD